MYWTPERPGYVWHDHCAQREGLLPVTPKPSRSKRRSKSKVEPLF
ncbi:hypothetical protein [Azospirillum picis]|uniref:Transposase n=1 Tax=Azospirillum picis TaxID=488438 RepID=A0ABU0MTV9_9PROT|nr:hypothetical protein [Azospirillum picis]MBP2302997.1 hypothetical protein [Azospirillum picis]MDQ0536749.1 hypothetical protein [Azospirillum picis]